ncbi:DUF4064 domain-containing protein [Staphylococcus devriesei]|uniref:DUF4064 domain-containing protein n=1 Tax=Staphylococcus devriesei TaxID=586733 RepID=A0A2K4DL86_9STAP|nr:DUF4064 domain-containing protein [Staphylococcus devriesei]MCE5089402.1 DUF4064 domain-containing protein [Staphylococcus devriesei]MCE5096348.1 DUF4064 domain-containing protein [Staphylococcus devriesei]PNZ87590.1 hypothetical protein CD147_07095 [Staphylococcus devriesei]PTE74546.1 DUF4064 domain-containing protein [Staphylococcus devriesei]PTF13404.1 DUF4064 domain-containing protein [Staphylococcus devriesei]
MNRKVELILAWIANGLSLIYLAMSLISFLIVKNENNTEQYNQLMKQFGNQDVNVTPEMINFAMMFSIGTLVFSTILGIIGTLVIKGRPILAGCLLIVAALVGIFNMSLIAGVLWFVAAIMLFVKKRPGRKQPISKRNSDQTEWRPEKEYNDRKKDDPYIY